MEAFYEQRTDEPDFSPQPGWSTVSIPDTTTAGASFVEGDPEGQRLRLRMFARDADARLCAYAWFGPEAEGPPQHAHGGSVAAILDHAMGVACWVGGHPVVAATITVNFHHSVPLRLVTHVEAWVERVEGKKVFAAGKIFHPEDEAPFSTATGLFIRTPMERFAGMLKR